MADGNQARSRQATWKTGRSETGRVEDQEAAGETAAESRCKAGASVLGETGAKLAEDWGESRWNWGAFILVDSL